MKISSLVLAISIGATSPPAQTTWVVDASGGAGSHFTTITAALAAAAPGDLVLVRAGTYNETTATSWPTTGKGLTLVADPGATLTGTGASGTPKGRFEVRGVPPGQSFAIAGLGLRSPSLLDIQNNQGRVHVERMSVAPNQLTYQPGLIVASNQQVSVTFVWGTGYAAAFTNNSEVVLHQCDFRTSYAVPLETSTSNVSIVDCKLTGSDESFRASAGSGLVVRSGHVKLAGPNTVISAGRPGGYWSPNSAVYAPSGTIEWDPAITLTSYGAANFKGGAVVMQRRIPSVNSSWLRSGPWTVSTHAPQGSPVCVMVGLPAAPFSTTPFGVLWLSPSSTVVFGCGITGPTETFLLQAWIQNPPAGLSVALQAAVLNGGNPELSIPAVVTVQ